MTLEERLEAAEKERDDGEKMSQALKQSVIDLTARATHAEARCKELERVGNLFAKEHHQEASCNCILCESVRAWTALVNTH